MEDFRYFRIVRCQIQSVERATKAFHQIWCTRLQLCRVISSVMRPVSSMLCVQPVNVPIPVIGCCVQPAALHGVHQQVLRAPGGRAAACVRKWQARRNVAPGEQNVMALMPAALVLSYYLADEHE